MSAPASVAFITGLRRSLIDPESKDDPETHRYNNIYIEVALSPDQVLRKKVGAFIWLSSPMILFVFFRRKWTICAKEIQSTIQGYLPHL